MHEISERYSTQQATRYLGLSPFTLKGWRRCGEGPPWIKLSTRRVVYDRADLDAFLAAHRQRAYLSSESTDSNDDAAGTGIKPNPVACAKCARTQYALKGESR